MKNEKYTVAGYTLCKENAKLHFDLANLLRDKEKTYSQFAIFHLITSLEEILKAIIVRINIAHSQEFTEKDFEEYWYGHPKKYKALTSLLNNFTPANTELEKDKTDIGIRILVVFGIFLLICIAGNTENDKHPELKDFMAIRNRSIYVDFIKEHQKWKSPKDVNKRSTAVFYFFMSFLYTQLESLINLQDSDFEKESKQILGLIKQK